MFHPVGKRVSFSNKAKFLAFLKYGNNAGNWRRV